jgi:hypothetical protein
VGGDGTIHRVPFALGFESNFCNPARGIEKGGVKGEQGSFRRNYLVPLPAARALEHLNELLKAASKKEEQRVIAGHSQTIGAAMVLAREHWRARRRWSNGERRAAGRRVPAASETSCSNGVAGKTAREP